MGQLGMKGRGRRKDMRWALDRISRRGRCRGDITKQHTCSCMVFGSRPYQERGEESGHCCQEVT